MRKRELKHGMFGLALWWLHDCATLIATHRPTIGVSMLRDTYLEVAAWFAG